MGAYQDGLGLLRISIQSCDDMIERSPHALVQLHNHLSFRRWQVNGHIVLVQVLKQRCQYLDGRRRWMFPAGSTKELTTHCASVTLHQAEHVTVPKPRLNSPDAAIYSDLAFRRTCPKQSVRGRLQRLQTPIKRARIDSLDRRLNAAQILG